MAEEADHHAERMARWRDRLAQLRRVEDADVANTGNGPGALRQGGHQESASQTAAEAVGRVGPEVVPISSRMLLELTGFSDRQLFGLRFDPQRQMAELLLEPA